MTAASNTPVTPVQRPAARRRSVTGRAAAVIGTAGALIVAVAAVLIFNGRDSEAGPLGFNYLGESTLSLQDMGVGVDYTYGFIVTNRAAQDAVLESVELVGDAAGVTVGPALTAGVDRGRQSVASAKGFPPATLGVPLSRLRNARVPARSDTTADGSPAIGVNILLHVVIRDGGVHRFSGTKIHYRVGDTEYTYTDPVDLTLCSATCSDT